MATSKVIDINSNDTVTRQQRRALERAEEKKNTYLMSAPSRGEVQQYVTGVMNEVLPPIVNEVRSTTLSLEFVCQFISSVVPAFKLEELAEFIRFKAAELQKKAELAPGPPGLSGPAEPACDRQASQEEPLTIPSPQGSIVLTD